MLIVAIIITAIATEKILIKNRVDAVDEVDKSIITLDINGQLYNSEYEYAEIDKSFLQ